MNDTSASIVKPALAALAVLGRADRRALAVLLDCDLSSQTLTLLRHEPAVTTDGERFMLSSDDAAELLAQFRETTPMQYRKVHERAVDYLAEQVRAGAEHQETRFLRVFERLADMLAADAPQQFIALVDDVRDVPLSSPAGRHRRRYYEGLALRKAEHYADALALFDDLLAVSGLDRELRARTLNSRAICCRLMGRLEDAFAGYRESLALWQQLGDRLYEGKVLLNMGIIAYDLHNYDDAYDHLRDAAVIFDQLGSSRWLAVARNELGLIHRDQGRLDEALACFRSFVTQRRSEGAHDHAGLGLNNIGEVLLFQGRLDAAEDAFRDALDAMTTRVYRVDTYVHLGLVYQAIHELRRAHTYFRKALDLSREIERRDILPHIHYRLSEIMHRQGDTSAALVQAQAGVDIIEETRAPLRDEHLKISLLSRWQQVYDAAVLRCLDLGRIADAIHYVERATARAFLDMLARRHTPQTLSPETPLSAASIQDRLPADTALVLYFATGRSDVSDVMRAILSAENATLRTTLVPPERLFAFVITSEHIDVVPLEITTRQIKARHFIRSNGRLRGTMPLPGRPLRPLRRWHDLYAQVLRPLDSYLAGIEHVFLIPHDVLHYLPLHALAGDDRPIGDGTTTYSYAPSASILINTVRNAPDSSSEPTCLAVGVDADDLTHAEAEARWIADRLSGQALLGETATPAAVRNAMRNCDVIHFSCHGRFRQRQPMDSALILAQDELTAAEILQSVRLHADIVTLSACDTGLNTLTPGDELLGLTRAFLGAGARSLLVTLWPIHEIPTRLFMERFYREWRAGASRATSVARAQHELRTADVEVVYERLAAYGLSSTVREELLDLFTTMCPGRRPFNHPYYWAAFVLIGDPS